jgi:hypothetical protein
MQSFRLCFAPRMPPRTVSSRWCLRKSMWLRRITSAGFDALRAGIGRLDHRPRRCGRRRHQSMRRPHGDQARQSAIAIAASAHRTVYSPRPIWM